MQSCIGRLIDIGREKCILCRADLNEKKYVLLNYQVPWKSRKIATFLSGKLELHFISIIILFFKSQKAARSDLGTRSLVFSQNIVIPTKFIHDLPRDGLNAETGAKMAAVATKKVVRRIIVCSRFIGETGCDHGVTVNL